MNLADLSPPVLEKIKALRYDRLVEKHEGPFDWRSELTYGDGPDFLDIAGRPVLLPVDRERHANIWVLRCLVSEDGRSLTVFLKDTTYAQDVEPAMELFYAGFVAVCDQIPGESFFVATVYHEWFIVDNAAVLAPKA